MAQTKGPLQVGPAIGYGGFKGFPIKDTRSGLVVAVAIGDVPELDARANATLFAAAPTLYDALYAILLITDREHVAWERARAALSAARGDA